jgi:hypothetical protein
MIIIGNGFDCYKNIFSLIRLADFVVRFNSFVKLII